MLKLVILKVVYRYNILYKYLKFRIKWPYD